MWIFAKFTSSPSGIDNEGMALFPEKIQHMKEIKNLGRVISWRGIVWVNFSLFASIKTQHVYLNSRLLSELSLII